jgi:Abnormal spindle-like microcephaly-assoc'd, ASPM-SPD-2-Hydin
MMAFSGAVVIGGCGVATVPGAILSASSTTVVFGDVAVGGSTGQLVTLTDTGTANVHISRVSVSGSGFSVSGGSNVTLMPNQSVTVSVGFAPTSVQLAQGKLSITSTASNGLVHVALSGNGQAAEHHSVTLNWQPSASSTIGYFVYRTNTQNGGRSRLNTSAENTTSFTDSTVSSGETYLYAVTSIDSSNVESAPSNQVTVTIPNP